MVTHFVVCGMLSDLQFYSPAGRDSQDAEGKDQQEEGKAATGKAQILRHEEKHQL